MPTDLKLKFPLYAIAAQETSEDQKAVFDEVRPKAPVSPTSHQQIAERTRAAQTRPTQKKTVTGKPGWVRQLPKTKMVWMPIVLSGVVPIFQTEALAKMFVGEQRLQLVFGSIDFIALETPEDVVGWMKKASKTSIKLHVVAISPRGEEVVATSDVDVEVFKAAVAVEEEK